MICSVAAPADPFNKIKNDSVFLFDWVAIITLPSRYMFLEIANRLFRKNANIPNTQKKSAV
eukprot:UN05071